MKKYGIIVLILLAAIATNAQQKDSFERNTEITKNVAGKYFNYYMALDWEKIEPLMHDEIEFDDPTAELAIGWQKKPGKANVMKHFREDYASIVNMTPNLTRSFFSGDVAVFEMNLEFSFNGRNDKVITIKMPLVTTLKLKDGKVIEHKDLGDYREYLKQLAEARKSNAPEKEVP